MHPETEEDSEGKSCNIQTYPPGEQFFFCLWQNVLIMCQHHLTISSVNFLNSEAFNSYLASLLSKFSGGLKSCYFPMSQPLLKQEKQKSALPMLPNTLSPTEDTASRPTYLL